MARAVHVRTRSAESRHLYDLSATYAANGATFQPICRKSGLGRVRPLQYEKQPIFRSFFSPVATPRASRLAWRDLERGRQRSRGKIDDASNMPMSGDRKRAKGVTRVPHGNRMR